MGDKCKKVLEQKKTTSVNNKKTARKKVASLALKIQEVPSKGANTKMAKDKSVKNFLREEMEPSNTMRNDCSQGSNSRRNIKKNADATTKNTSQRDKESKDIKLRRQACWADKFVFIDRAFTTICKEFRDNKSIKPEKFTTEAFMANDMKNRYNDILCIDSTRVVLKQRPSDNDYIHANWITMPNKHKYISTQGPLEETIEDFLHMVITEKSPVIVMVCNWTEIKCEKKESKCARYFLKGTTKEFGPYKVSVKEEQKDPFESIKHTILEIKTGETTELVHHLANHDWHDHIAPESPVSTVGMLQLARKLAKESPITVHCSAGIGRTATFIAIDLASQRILASDTVSMLDILREMRSMRFHAIQSAIQWMFLHACILQYFVENGFTTRKTRVASFLRNYAKNIQKYTTKQQKLDEANKKLEEAKNVA